TARFVCWRGPQRGFAARPAYARAGSGALGPNPALRASFVGAGPSAATPRVPLMLAPVWGPLAPTRHCALRLLARAPARLRRASRLCSRLAGVAPALLPGDVKAPLAEQRDPRDRRLHLIRMTLAEGGARHRLPH